MCIESELLRKQNFWQADTWICLQKGTKSAIIVWVFNLAGKTELFRIPEFMIVQTFSFPQYISTLFIWFCRVCYFAWWTQVLWGCRATLVFIESVADTLRSVHLHTHNSPMSHETRKQQKLNPVRLRTKRDQYDEEHPAVV